MTAGWSEVANTPTPNFTPGIWVREVPSDYHQDLEKVVVEADSTVPFLKVKWPDRDAYLLEDGTVVERRDNS